MGIKEGVLAQLKAQWKVAVEEQFQKDPDKVRNADIGKNADEIMNNPAVALAARGVGITKDDIVTMLTEIRNEVCGNESNTR